MEASRSWWSLIASEPGERQRWKKDGGGEGRWREGERGVRWRKKERRERLVKRERQVEQREGTSTNETAGRRWRRRCLTSKSHEKSSPATSSSAVSRLDEKFVLFTHVITLRGAIYLFIISFFIWWIDQWKSVNIGLRIEGRILAEGGGCYQPWGRVSDTVVQPSASRKTDTSTTSNVPLIVVIFNPFERFTRSLFFLLPQR